MTRRFAISDIHGAHKALVQVLKRVKFDYDKDELIVIGDVVDAWPETMESIDELMKIKNLTYILGNHDQWVIDYYELTDAKIMAKHPSQVEIFGISSIRKQLNENWFSQGGQATLNSYPNKRVTKEHLDFLKEAKLYHEVDDMVFVHGGFDTNHDISIQHRDELIWNRELIQYAYIRSISNGKDTNFKLGRKYKKIFIGHTPTMNYPKGKVDGKIMPLKLGNVIAIDTGASYSGPLTIINIDTLEIGQSDVVKTLYPGITAR